MKQAPSWFQKLSLVGLCLFPLIFWLAFPATSSAQTLSTHQDPNAFACGTPLTQPLSDGSFLASTCLVQVPFSPLNPFPFIHEGAAAVTLSFFSPNPQNWQHCEVSMQVDDITEKYTLPYTVQSYPCLQDASLSRQNVSYSDAYGSIWPNALFTILPGHTYQVHATIDYQYHALAPSHIQIQSNQAREQ